MNSEWADQPKAPAAHPGATPGATIGAQLAAQREAMGLTVDQIADQLKLAPRQVVALEAGDYDALPNMAVTRGFVRAYAKVVKIDAAPLVAMIEVNPVAGHERPPVRREMVGTAFSESRFPSMTERSSRRSGWLMGAALVAVVAAAFGAYHVGLFPNLTVGGLTAPAAGAPAVSASASASAAPVAPAATPAIATVPAGTTSAPLQSPNVPLISVPPQDGASATTPAGSAATVPGMPAQGVQPAPAAAAPGVAAAGVAVKPVTPAVTPAATASAGGVLVLKAIEDSWITIQPPGKKVLVSRMLKAGSTETFDIAEPALLIVGKPSHVQATLRGAALELPPVPGGTISRVSVK